MEYPLIRADFWIGRKTRSHFIEHRLDDPDFVASKDFGDVLDRLAEQGYSQAALISPSSQWQITFERRPDPKPSNEE